MRNPEAQFLERFTIDQAFQRAQEMLTREALKPEQFIIDDPASEEDKKYSRESVAKDVAYVEEKEREYRERDTPEQREAQKLATVFEAIIHERAEMSNWLGPDAATIKSSRYDDIKNGVDTIVEFQESDTTASHLALAIDATFSTDTEAKFNRIREEIDQGKLATVKYFTSEYIGKRKGLPAIPRVVVGADAKTIKELAELWLERDRRALDNHPVQFQILEEITMQLDAFGRYASTVGKHDLADTYHEAAKVLAGIASERYAAVKDNEERDSMFYAIQENARNFGKIARL